MDIAFIFAALIGAVLRQLFGLYKVYQSGVPVQFDPKRILIEIIACFTFGLFGILLLKELGMAKALIGTAIVAAGAGFFGPDMLNILAKKIGVNITTQAGQLSGVNFRQQKAVEFIRMKGSISNDEYKRLNGCSDVTAVRDVNELVKKGIVKKQGKTRSIRYSF